MFERHAFHLLGWFESHNKGQGKYLSNAHHPIWGVENDNRLPHTFHYYGLICSYVLLYKKLKKEKYLDKAKEAADFLCSLQKWSGQFRYDTFEFDTKKPTGLTLIHNALPSIALLELYKVSKVKKYLVAAKRNISWFYCRLWNGKYLSGCVNQDLCAAEALAVLYEIEGKEVYKKRAKKLADNLLWLQIKEGVLKGGFIRGVSEKDLVIPWYDALTALSYHHIGIICDEEKYKNTARITADFIKKNLSNKGLVHWYLLQDNQWKKKEEPMLVAPAGVALSLYKELGIKTKVNLLAHQNNEGSFPLSYYYTDQRAEPNLGWNQFMLLYLCSEAEKEVSVREIQKERKGETREKSVPVVEVQIISLGKEGYVDVIKDHFVIKSYKMAQRKVSIAKQYFSEGVLRFRMVNSRWKTIQPNTKLLKVCVVPYWVILPYVLVEELVTRVLQRFFEKPLLEKLIKIKVWRR